MLLQRSIRYVSEELSSVETSSPNPQRVLLYHVSEELSSVETFIIGIIFAITLSFQKNLVVWKLGSQIFWSKFLLIVSEELSSVETFFSTITRSKYISVSEELSSVETPPTTFIAFTILTSFRRT